MSARGILKPEVGTRQLLQIEEDDGVGGASECGEPTFNIFMFVERILEVRGWIKMMIIMSDDDSLYLQAVSTNIFVSSVTCGWTSLAQKVVDWERTVTAIMLVICFFTHSKKASVAPGR